MTPILQMRKPVPTEVKSRAQGHTAGPSWAGIEPRCSGSYDNGGCPLMSGVNYWRWMISELHQSVTVLSREGLPCCMLLTSLARLYFLSCSVCSPGLQTHK